MNTTLSQQVKVADLETQRRVWIALNKGVLANLAREFGVSAPFVTDIFKQRVHSRLGKIEERLTELGAPGFVGKK